MAHVSAASAAKSSALAMAAVRQEYAREVQLSLDLDEEAPEDAGAEKKISLQKRLLAAKPTIVSLVEAAQLAQLSAAPAAKFAASALTALRNEVSRIALAGDDQVCPDLALFEQANADSDKNISLQKVLISLQMRFWDMDLKRDPDDRVKLPKALPKVEIESKNIASFLIEEPLIIFLEAPFFGEKGQVTGLSSHGVFYTDNKGVPLRILMGKHFNGTVREIAPYALQSTLFDAENNFPSIRYRIFSARKFLVKAVQEKMSSLKVGKKVSNDRYTEIAETLIAKGSTIEFIAAKNNHIACFLAYLAGKIGIYRLT